MKNILKRGVIVLIVLFLSINIVLAVGIKWFTEGESVQENSEKCINYGAYNPSDKDIKVKVEITGSLNEVISGTSFEDKIIKANTASANSENIKVCFKIPKIYEEDCWISNLICKQECSVPVKAYSGELLMTEAPLSSKIGETAGSGATIAASAPLALTVNCKQHGRDLTIIYILIIVLVVLFLIKHLYKKYSKPKIERDTAKLEKLKQKIEREKNKK